MLSRFFLLFHLAVEDSIWIASPDSAVARGEMGV